MLRSAKRCVKEVRSSFKCFAPYFSLTPPSDVGGGIGAAVVRDRSDCIALIGGGKYSKYSSNQVHRQLSYRMSDKTVQRLLG